MMGAQSMELWLVKACNLVPVPQPTMPRQLATTGADAGAPDSRGPGQMPALQRAHVHIAPLRTASSSLSVSLCSSVQAQKRTMPKQLATRGGADAGAPDSSGPGQMSLCSERMCTLLRLARPNTSDLLGGASPT